MGGHVKKSIYRQPPTPEGIKKIEKGELKWFDNEVFPNVGTGLLEQYFDEKNRTPEGFSRSRFYMKKVAIGVAIGMAFALINQYVGLKVGLVTGGAWYITYLLGLAWRWNPSETNIISGAATGADRTCTGFVFTFPSIFLLAYSTEYLGGGGKRLVDPSALGTIIPVALVASILAAFMGIMYFIIFRRVWLVEDPLPMPAIHASIKLLDISHHLSSGAVEEAKKSIKIVVAAASASALFAFMRDFSIVSQKDGSSTSILDSLFHSQWYGHGTINITPKGTGAEYYTFMGVTLTPIQFSIGWFMKFRTALLVTMGTLLTFFVIMPLAVAFQTPVYIVHVMADGSIMEGFYRVTDPTLRTAGVAAAPSYIARDRIGRIIAIGAILGGGFTALIKMAPVFATATKDITQVVSGREDNDVERKDWVKGRGWYEWPVSHIPLMMTVALIGITAAFSLGGFPVQHSFVFALLLVLFTFFLGAIAVKVSGEVGTTPVSGTSFITLLLLVVVFRAIPGIDEKTMLLMALLGTTVFGSSISLSSDIMWDFRSGIYCGSRPYHLMKGETTGIFFGSIVSVIGASFFSFGLAQGMFPDLEAPQAHAFATFAQIITGAGGGMIYTLLLMGIAIGVIAELTTGMGTAFGLGMYLPLSYEIPLLIGGASRDLWEKYYLHPRAKAEGWDEQRRTMKLLETFMIATGLLVGEAIMGTINAIYIMLNSR